MRMTAQVQESSPLGPLSLDGEPAGPIVRRAPRLVVAVVLFTLAALLAAAIQFVGETILWTLSAGTPLPDFNYSGGEEAQVGGEVFGPLQTLVSSGPGQFAGLPAIAIVVALLAVGILVLPSSAVRKIVGVILVLIGYPLAFVIQYELIWMASIQQGTLINGLVPAIAVLAVSIAWILNRNRSRLAWISLIVVAGVPSWWVFLFGLGVQFFGQAIVDRNPLPPSPDSLASASIAAALTLLAFCLPVVVIAWIAALLDRRRHASVQTSSEAAQS
jgi:hypothetical protein